MLVGLTYDLRADYLAMGYGEEETAEFDRESTIEAIERELHALGHRTERVGQIRRLVERLAAGARWDLVFNIAEGVSGFGREAQVPALLDAWFERACAREPELRFQTAQDFALSLHLAAGFDTPIEEHLEGGGVPSLASERPEPPIFELERHSETPTLRFLPRFED